MNTRGDEEIFPHPRAQEMSALWNKSHQEYERASAAQQGWRQEARRPWLAILVAA
jgi:hypothetical protein